MTPCNPLQTLQENFLVTPLTLFNKAQPLKPIEEHVLILSDIRRMMICLNDPKKVKRYALQLDALLKCIKGERTALGLPSHIVGMSTEIPKWYR